MQKKSSLFKFYTILSLEIIGIYILWSIFAKAALPTPWEILIGVKEIWTQDEFSHHLRVSLRLCFEGLFVSTVCALIISYGTKIPKIGKYISPVATFISVTRFQSLVGILFALMLYSPGAHIFKIMLITYGMTGFLTTSFVAVINEIPDAKFEHARTLRLSELRVFWEVVVRGKRHMILEVMAQTFAIAFGMLSMVESYVRNEGGIGVYLSDMNKQFNMAKIFAVQLTIMLTGLLSDFGIRLVNKWLHPYAFMNTKGSHGH